jgi:hypothetical protein
VPCRVRRVTRKQQGWGRQEPDIKLSASRETLSNVAPQKSAHLQTHPMGLGTAFPASSLPTLVSGLGSPLTRPPSHPLQDNTNPPVP